MNQEDPKKKPGPEEDRLKIEGDWEDAVAKAMGKPRPEQGWPNQDEKRDDQVEKTPPE